MMQSIYKTLCLANFRIFLCVFVTVFLVCSLLCFVNSTVNSVGCRLCNGLYCTKARKAERSSFSHVGNVQRRVLLQIQITLGAWLKLCVSPLVLSSLCERSVLPFPFFHSLWFYWAFFFFFFKPTSPSLFFSVGKQTGRKSRALTHVCQIDASTCPSAPFPWLQIIITMDTSTNRA